MTGTGGSAVGRKLWLHVFKNIFSPWSENELYDYLDLFAEINTKVSHNDEDSIQAEQVNMVYRFIEYSIEFIKRSNAVYMKLLSKECVSRSGWNIFFSLCKFKDQNHLTACQIPKDDAKRIVELIGNKNRMVPLDDQDFISQYFGIEYRIFMALLGFLANQDEHELEQTKMKVQLVADRNPDVLLNMIALI